MTEIYTYKDYDTVKDLLNTKMRWATLKDYVVLTQMINSCILDRLIERPHSMTLVAKYPEDTIKGVEIRLASHYFDNREGIVFSKDGSYIGGWMDLDNIRIMLKGVSQWFEYMDKKYKEQEEECP